LRRRVSIGGGLVEVKGGTAIEFVVMTGSLLDLEL